MSHPFHLRIGAAVLISLSSHIQHTQELDLTGAREFLTRETAEELLAPLLAPGAKITKVGHRLWMWCWHAGAG